MPAILPTTRSFAVLQRPLGLERFSPWCPKIFCSIGRLDRVLESRCVVIPMQAKKPSETVRPFNRMKLRPQLEKVAGDLAGWVAVKQEEITRAYEALPESLFDSRAGENIAPLQAILSVADSGRLPEFQLVVETLGGANASVSDSNRAPLLSDIQAVFVEGNYEQLSSEELTAALVLREGSLWGDWYGKPLTSSKLARLLKPFGVVPDRVGPAAPGLAATDYLNSKTALLGI